MGLSNALPLSTARPKPVTVPPNLPRSFQEALKLGWTVIKEETTITINNRKRNGIILLRLAGSPMQLRIPYSSTARSWHFGAPEAIPFE
jgi:hypothetical protein